MTNNEIDKLLTMLDSKSLEQVKVYLTKQKEKNVNNLRQRTFEKYMCNDGKGTYLAEDKNVVVFTNGISIYEINKGVFNIKSPKLQKNINFNRNLHQQHRIHKISIEKAYNVLDQAKKYQTELKLVEFEQKFDSKITRFTTLKDYIGEVEFDFSTREIDIAEILLDNPKFKMDVNNPLVYAENDNGKVYILGFKKKEQN